MILLDTQAFLWTLEGSERLSAKAAETVSAHPEELAISVAGLWEIAIKEQIGKLELAQPFEVFIREQVEGRELTLVGITSAHILRYHGLPLHHRDPFDRMLAAQALFEDAAVVSNDKALDPYGVRRIW